VVEIGVGADVGRVLAAQLQSEAHELAERRLLDCMAAGDRAGEVAVRNFRRGDDLGGVVVGQHEVLEQALGQAGGIECLLKPLGAERRLGGVLQDDGIAGHQRRHDAIDRGQVRVVPGCDDEDNAQRFAADEAHEAGLVRRLDVGQRLACDLDHVARALFEAAHLAGALGNRPAHLARDLLRVLVLVREEDVDRLAQDLRALGNGRRLPLALRFRRCFQGGDDLRRGGVGPLDIDAVVDRCDGLLRGCHDDSVR
jgi:hypothetical protein